MRPSLAWLALVALAPQTALADEPPSWVFFADRGADDTAQALTVRSLEISPRALQRRQRVRGDGGVDIRDLPPAQTHVAAVLATGATLRETSRWLNAISVEATPNQLAAISALPGVARVQPVARTRGRVDPRAQLEPPPPTHEETYGVSLEQLELLGVPLLHDCGLTGAGVVIGVQDSGFLLAHRSLANVQVIAAHDFVKDDDDVAQEPDDADGQDNHGTMVLSTIAGDDPGMFMGAAPGVSVILSKTEDVGVEEPFEEDHYVAGLEWIESMGADLFTASLGYTDWYEPADMDGETAVTTLAADIAVANGLIMFNSMGNEGPEPTTMSAPADAEGVISVGAIDFDGLVTEFSSRGPTADGRIKPNIVAPGLGVAVVHPNDPEAYVAAKGTSFSAPLAAGAAALLLEAMPGTTPAEMRAMLQAAGDRTGSPDSDYGWGLPDVSKPLRLMCTCTDNDRDGHYAIECGGDDCDDTNFVVRPGAAEICDGFDNNCDGQLPPGELDADGDGVRVCDDDCDDTDRRRSPDESERCGDEIDNDCDSQIDESDCTDPAPTTGDVSESSESSNADPDIAQEPGACACRSSSPPLLLLPLLLLLLRRRHQPR